MNNCHACNIITVPDANGNIQLQLYQNCQCYKCQKHRGEPTLHPLVGLSLGIATGGLSCAAMGIYRGVAMHKARKAREAGLLAGSAGGQEVMQVPSSILALPAEKNASAAYAEVEGSSPVEHKVSEMVGSPVEAAPPQYSEVVGSPVSPITRENKY